MSVRGTSPSLRVALPWWDASVREARETQSLPALAASDWLESRAARVTSAPSDWRAWLLEATAVGRDVLTRLTAGPCVSALAAVACEPDAAWAMAQPVHLATAIDHLRLDAPSLPDLEAADAESLRTTLDAHLRSEGHALLPAVAGLWLLRCARRLDCTSHDPAAVVGRNLRDCLPEGPDGRDVRRLMNECQMLLHEHPVNVRRAAQGRRAANAVWLWGFGASGRPSPTALPRLVTDDPWLAGLWHLHGESSVSAVWPSPAGGPVAPGPLLAVGRPAAAGLAEALAVADAQLLQVVRDHVRTGPRGNAMLYTGERVIELDAWSRWRFWRAPSSRLGA